MWKDSFTARIRVFLAIFMLLFTINVGLVISTVNNSNDLNQVKSDIQNIEYIFLFILFLVAVMLFFYIPLLLHRKLRQIHRLLKEVTEGNYTPEIDEKEFEQDREFLNFVLAIQKMLQVIVKFDQLKSEKITEHNNRIIGLLNLACNGFIIVAGSGDVIYTNDLTKDNFHEFQKSMNFYDDIFSDDIEKSIKPYIHDILHTGSKGADITIHFDSIQADVVVKSNIVRDQEGEPIGAVLALYGLPGYLKMTKPREV